MLEADIYRPDFDFTGVDRLTQRPDEELAAASDGADVPRPLVVYRRRDAAGTTTGISLAVPPREGHPEGARTIFVSYTFSGEWQTIWTTLVVRLWYSQEFEHRELWRNAAEFASSRGHTAGSEDSTTGKAKAEATHQPLFRRQDAGRVESDLHRVRTSAPGPLWLRRDAGPAVCVRRSAVRPVTDLALVRKRFAAGKDFITCQSCDERVQLIDFIEQRLKSDPVARKILAMEETATRELDTQALEQILIGHVQAITGEANQIFRELTKFDYGIDGEIEFKDNDGRPSGKKIYVQLKSGNSYLRTRKSDGREVFDVKNDDITSNTGLTSPSTCILSSARPTNKPKSRRSAG